MADYKAAVFVRKVSRYEAIEALIDEAKFRAWRDQSEHMVLKLIDGERLMVKGGSDGINFVRKAEGGKTTLHMKVSGHMVRVARIFGHTHPRVTGPSDGDLAALTILGQKRSYIFEIGGDPRGTLIRPKSVEGEQTGPPPERGAGP